MYQNHTQYFVIYVAKGVFLLLYLKIIRIRFQTEIEKEP
jgi:hypothetical protein